MGQNFLATNVYDEAIRRINFVYDHCDDVIVSSSGGKDSTVLYELTKMVARQRNRLPLKVYWLDQEAEWKATEDYMHSVMYDPEVTPYWFQIPFRLTNSLSFKDNFLNVWAEADRAVWVRDQDPISIKLNPTKYDRFHDLVENLPAYCDCADKKHVGVLVGMRITESNNRRMAITESKAKFKGITWCRSPIKNTRVFWPIYDWTNGDIWTALGSNEWKYNVIYDQFYRYGMAGNKMRVSALIHETAWHNIEQLQEVEPRLYDKFLRRVHGVNAFSHFKREIMPTKLPSLFASWLEYRDYLLEALIEPEHWDIFRKRWTGQDEDRWHAAHVREIMVNDIDGTINANYRSTFKLQDGSKDGGYYKVEKNKRRLDYERRMREQGQ